jgi:hypothetical protein
MTNPGGSSGSGMTSDKGRIMVTVVISNWLKP